MPKNQCKTKYPLYLPKIGQHSAGHLSAFIASFSLYFLSEFIGVHQRLAFFSLLLSEFIRVYQWLAFFSLFFSESIRVHQWLNVFLCSSMAAKENTGLKSQPRVVIKKKSVSPFYQIRQQPDWPGKQGQQQPSGALRTALPVETYEGQSCSLKGKCSDNV